MSLDQLRFAASGIADPTASAAAIALASLSLPDGEQLLELLSKRFQDGKFAGDIDANILAASRERLTAILDQARIFRNYLIEQRSKNDLP